VYNATSQTINYQLYVTQDWGDTNTKEKWWKVLFTCHISPISSIASSFDASIQQYADDIRIYIALTTADVIAHLTRLSSCLSALHYWFCHNGLALNSSKSESILFGTRQRLRNFPLVSTPTIAGSQIPFSDNIKTLGVTLDANLTLNQHVSSLCKSMHFHSTALCHIREICTAWPPH